MQQQVVDALLRLKTSRSDTKPLKDKTSVIAIFGAGQTQNESVKDDSDKDDSDSQWEATNKAGPYIPTALMLAYVHKEHLPTL